jgi:hypothetical protein
MNDTVYLNCAKKTGEELQYRRILRKVKITHILQAVRDPPMRSLVFRPWPGAIPFFYVGDIKPVEEFESRVNFCRKKKHC